MESNEVAKEKTTSLFPDETVSCGYGMSRRSQYGALKTLPDYFNHTKQMEFIALRRRAV